MNRTTMIMARDFYVRRLIELNPVLIVTPAKLEILNRQAEALRQGMLRTESNPIWKIPVVVQSDGTNPTRFEVIFVDN